MYVHLYVCWGRHMQWNVAHSTFLFTLPSLSLSLPLLSLSPSLSSPTSPLSSFSLPPTVSASPICTGCIHQPLSYPLSPSLSLSLPLSPLPHLPFPPSLYPQQFLLALSVLGVFTSHCRTSTWLLALSLSPVSEFSFLLASRARRLDIISREVCVCVWVGVWVGVSVCVGVWVCGCVGVWVWVWV